MIYVSSSCIKNDKISQSVQQLAVNGFKNIELSGGTRYYDNLENDLLALQNQYDLNYQCHNYFPPPINDFVLNLASLNDCIFERSFNHIKDSISLSKKLGAKKFGFHAGFFVDISVSEIGLDLTKVDFFDRSESFDRFCSAFNKLKNLSCGVELYIENNVLSQSNYNFFNRENPLMLTNHSDHKILANETEFNLLFDIAHLKVSSQSLGLNWEYEYDYMMRNSNYIHISDNDGRSDLNQEINRSSDLLSLLRCSDTNGKDFTLETYGGIDVLKRSYECLEEAVCK